MQNQMMPKINLLQMPDPAARTAKYVNMMNATKQQETAERQAAMAQRTLTLQEQKGAREEAMQAPAMTKAKQDNIVQALSLFREAVSDIAEGDTAAAEAVRAELIERVPGYDKFVRPATEWTPAYKNQLKLTAEKEIEKTIATPVASLELDTRGNPRSVTVGGFNPQQSPVYDAPETPMAAPRTPVAPAAPPPANPFASGYKPNAAAAAPGSLPLVIDSALETGVMAQADYDKILSNMAPQARPKIEAWARQNNIQIVPNAPNLTDNQMRGAPADFAGEMRAAPMAYDGQTPQSQFANLPPQRMQSQTAGLRGAPPMEQTMAQTQPRTITQLQQRNPNVSPLPGSSQVPLPRLGAEKRTEAQASKDVELDMAPKIAAANKKAENAIALKSEAPRALSGVKSVVRGLDDYIDTIDRLLRSPDRSSIVGRFEGRVPYVLQNERQAELQADFDKIKNTDTLSSLVEMKQASPTGGSPVGNASNQDVLLVARGANALVQTGGVPKFDQELKNIRRQAYRARQAAIEEYNNRFGELASSDPRFKLTTRATADRYISSKDLQQNKTSAAAPKTPVIPDAAKQMLRKNPTPQQRAFFDRTFGKGASARVLGGGR